MEKNKVYYGEYSLKHWTELILKKNIILPEYQRLFVWNEGKVKFLIEAFKENQFVPPVTIGAFKENGETQNLILDGQQRLTSIFLAYLSLFPDKEIFKSLINERSADENDNYEDADEQLDDILDWRFDKLTDKGKTKESILSEIAVGNYKTIDLGIDDKFLKTTFLGFSYLVPQVTDPKKQQKYYSSVFRSINFQGENLSPQESRKSLYFLDKNLANYFDPDFCKAIKIKNPNTDSKIDFVRYLSLLSQYKKNGDANKVARGYKQSTMEKYYEDYIYSITGDNNLEIFNAFSETFPNNEYSAQIDNLRTTIDDLAIPKEYTSIIDSDIYLFGLVYAVLYNKKEIDITKAEELKQTLRDEISSCKGNSKHTRSPGAMKYLRHRMSQSIEIYSNFTKNE